mmetsp:Transcript_3837/g.7361  ORF Transcript_3837/g.7361 Transcript_3837/m.7361 type:complete len:305 (-) Transcript_3837:485-1399(-)
MTVLLPRDYDRSTSLSRRKHVPPSFNDIRHILNMAQVYAISEHLKLITFDGDQTLYPDGENIGSPKLVDYLTRLLLSGIKVAVVTAAGYKDDPERYEDRLRVLLETLRGAHLPPEVLTNFYVMGGESSYLFRCSPAGSLVSVPDDDFLTEDMKSWDPAKIQTVLDVAENCLHHGIERLNLDVSVMRKPRAVGIVNRASTLSREQLDELVLSTKHEILEANQGIPFCAFNGGSDVWIDIGNKLIGVKALQGYLRCQPHETLHVGDQFLSTGNDIATRQACCTVWIANPEETTAILETISRCRSKP